MTDYFQYGEKEIAWLKRADKRLGEVIDRIGGVKRRVIPDLFAALIYCIVGQQISTKAQETIWQRMQAELGRITSAAISELPPEALQRFGISFRKVTYIQDIARKITGGAFDIDASKE